PAAAAGGRRAQRADAGIGNQGSVGRGVVNQDPRFILLACAGDASFWASRPALALPTPWLESVQCPNVASSRGRGDQHELAADASCQRRKSESSGQAA